MNPAFLKAFELTLGKEGGYSDDPQDRGNWTSGQIGVGELKGTKFGISAASHSSEDIKALTILRAQEIYYNDFWFPLWLDDVLSAAVAAEIFDTAVNAGKTKAIQIAQQALNYLGAELAVDGKIGPETVKALNAYADERALLKTLNGLQFMHYFSIVTQFPEKQKYARGWLKRIEI